MLNKAIVAAFLATSAAAFGVTTPPPEAPPCKTAQPAPERAQVPAGRPLGTVDVSPRDGCERPRTVRS
ncbi:MAG: hypothetical protein U1E63_04745 [Burkholderiales bacterium]